MEMRAAIQIRTMIKAMTEVVLPAVDPQHAMAQEQARLVIGMLQFMVDRLHLQFRYDRDELARYVAVSEALIEQAKGGQKTRDAVRDLRARVLEGAEVIARARAEPGDLEAAVFALRAKVSALVQSVDDDGESASQATVRRLVLAAAKDQTNRERAWVIGMGFDPDPTAVPPLDRLIGLAPAP